MQETTREHSFSMLLTSQEHSFPMLWPVIILIISLWGKHSGRVVFFIFGVVVFFQDPLGGHSSGHHTFFSFLLFSHLLRAGGECPSALLVVLSSGSPHAALPCAFSPLRSSSPFFSSYTPLPGGLWQDVMLGSR